MNWIELPGGKYTVLGEKDRRSLCQIEVNCQYVHPYGPN